MASFLVKFKIFFAYLALAVVGGIAVWVVFLQVETLSKPDEMYGRINERNQLVNTAMYYMYKTENDGIQLFLGRRNKSEYKKDLKILYATLDSLKTFASDSVQSERIDSIIALFAIKQVTLGEMSGSSDLVEYNDSINKRILGFKPDSSSLNNQLLAETKVNVRRDTIVTKRKSGNFFKRFKGVFKKSHADSTIITTSSIKVDSSHVALADSINKVIVGLQDDMTKMQSNAVGRQKAALSKLSADNSGINAMIYRLIEDFEAEETSILLREISIRESEQDSTVKIIVAMAIAALLIILFFLWIIWRDIDKSNRQKKKLEKLNSDNLALMDAREKLMLAITHDIKAPLSSIIGYADLLDRLSMDKRQKLYISNIKSSSDMMQALVSDLLEFYRLDSDKEDLKIVSFNASEFFSSIYNLFLPVAEKKGLSLNLESDFSEDLCLESDPIKIRQIVNNLVSNAIKFTDEGHVDIIASYSDNILKITVKDSGRGISEYERGKLFDMFVRTSSSTGVQGFGLGLSIVDRTVKLLCGTINVESKVGVGSSFEVQLMVDSTLQSVVESKENENEPQQVEKMDGCRVLLVDDDELQMNLVCEICKSHGIVADKCQYPSFAKRMVTEADYSLVITDIQMPEMSGFDVLKEIRSVNQGIPVVAVTARTVDRDEYLHSGFFDVLTKPFREKDLITLIKSVFAPFDDNSADSDSETSGNVSGLQALYRFADGDDEAKRNILQSFVEQTGISVAALKEAVSSDDVKTVNMLCHKMMPIFSMMGESTIVTSLRAYEHSEVNMPSSVLEQLIESINKVVDAAKKELL